MLTKFHSSEIQKFPENFLAEVSSHFPPDFMTQVSEECEVYGKDWTRIYKPNPSAVVFPRTTAEVAKFLSLCSVYRQSVVPSGGRTGLSGGAVAMNGEIVLSLSRMNGLSPVDTLAQTVRVQAGAVTESVHEHCRSAGLTWPIDFASKGSSHIGGNIATNAGGVRVIRYGLTRNWVLGLQVVTMEGQILELNGALEKNNTGVDLRQLFIGSEGTLGIITEATLKLTRLPNTPDIFFFGLDSVADVLKLFHEARKSPFPITAFEFLTRNCLELVMQKRGLKSPFSHFHSHYVLFECEQPLHVKDQSILDEWLEGIFEKNLVKDGVLAQSSQDGKNLWALREGISESLAVKGFVHKNDIALPLVHLEKFIAEMDILFSQHPEVEIFLFGHIGDGNLHVNTMQPSEWEKEKFLQLCHQTDEHLFQLVKKYRGSISAEHGIGLLKKNALHFVRSPEEIALMKKLKDALDPLGLLNPGKIFDSALFDSALNAGTTRE
jgi:FAD/FMN-containing dehydrogenase